MKHLFDHTNMQDGILLATITLFAVGIGSILLHAFGAGDAMGLITAPILLPATSA